MLLVLSILALSVGTVQTATDLSENNRLAIQEAQPAVVQVISQPSPTESSYELLGL